MAEIIEYSVTIVDGKPQRGIITHSEQVAKEYWCKALWTTPRTAKIVETQKTIIKDDDNLERTAKSSK